MLRCGVLRPHTWFISNNNLDSCPFICRVYGQLEPPSYDLRAITEPPLAIFHGGRDRLADPEASAGFGGVPGQTRGLHGMPSAGLVCVYVRSLSRSGMLRCIQTRPTSGTCLPGALPPPPPAGRGHAAGRAASRGGFVHFSGARLRTHRFYLVRVLLCCFELACFLGLAAVQARPMAGLQHAGGRR